MSMTKSEAKTAVPRLRFPGFEEPWLNDPLSKTLVEHKLKNASGRDVFSVSMESGVVNQVEHLGRSFAASDTAHYNLARRFDVVYTKSPLKAFPFGIVKQCKFDGEIAVSPLYGVFTPHNSYVGLMIEAYFESPSRSQAFLAPLCQKGAKNTIQVTNAKFLSGHLPLPLEPAEQQKIAECLTSLDEVIAAQDRKVEAVKVHKHGLMQQLFPREGEAHPRRRFPEFCDAPEWNDLSVGDLIVTITPPKKLQTTSYAPQGLFPVVDQSPSSICGWTDDVDAVISPDQPVIIFGDHTCTLKLMKVPFAQGADGIKILKSTADVAIEFLFQALQVRPIESNEYKRHFSDLKEMRVRLPSRDSGEQEKIASALAVIDAQIAAESDRLLTLKIHKQGLMQQLFPQRAG